MNSAPHARAYCHRQFERLHEAAANTGYRLPFSGGSIKTYAVLLLKFSNTPEAPLQELLNLAVTASQIRKQLEAFDAGEMDGK
jgi:hypothetical protein